MWSNQIFHYTRCITPKQGRRERGQGGKWTRGPWILGDPWASGRPLASALDKGPIEMTLRNQHVKPEDPFFGDHQFRPERPLEFWWRPFFFFWRSHQFSDQAAAFPSSILDFTKPEIRHIWAGPGPLLVPGATAPKRVASLRGPSPRHCARATQLLSKKFRSGGEPLAKLCLIWPARDLNLRPPAPEANALRDVTYGIHA